MQIVERDNKYYLQFESGELELSEQQVKKRVERGDTLLKQAPSAKAFKTTVKPTPQPVSQPISQPIATTTATEAEPKIEATPSAIEATYEPIISEPIPTIKIEKVLVEEAQGDVLEEDGLNINPISATSAKYFDYILSEFESIFIANKDDSKAQEKLIKFCINAINKLENDRKNPRTDHVLIDYYILSWNRVIDFVQKLPEKLNDEAQVASSVSVTPANNLIEPIVAAAPPTPQPEDYVKQLMIIQLMQAEGLFPINNAIEGVTQQDIITLMGGILNVEKSILLQAMHQASAILLKRQITPENLPERIKLLEELDKHFEQLPYPNIISRVKLLLKIYHNK
ncbi:MAG TPA: hypothetical protein PLQ78_07515 [Flavipsychrobacter sp.]|jgi:hypothetical protein|nr:hypothetical protein [Flavipsychrobacter sp.]